MGTLHQQSDIAHVTLTAAFLGVVSGGATVIAIVSPTQTRLAIYIISLAVFHFCEFFLTALYHPETVSPQSFLLDHSVSYTVSVLAAILEYTILHSVWSGILPRKPLFLLGLLMIIFGQFLRTKAMVDAKSAFTHEVAQELAPGHKLIQDGIFRHPSYAGFFLWALGTQLLLGNVLGLGAFAYLLQHFFRNRIHCEEYYLERFFPRDYPEYKRKCWSGIPYVD